MASSRHYTASCAIRVYSQVHKSTCHNKECVASSVGQYDLGTPKQHLRYKLGQYSLDNKFTDELKKDQACAERANKRQVLVLKGQLHAVVPPFFYFCACVHSLPRTHCSELIARQYWPRVNLDLWKG
ncbi:hypothetical protein AVEN_215378-1 [Araneus ventricosus]|uniref:Uncharacterized protein n=1 Tax=Araneus ventricosus TaxID=182803 RepID=A0A4Y2KX64_ARAVE|nr:hypothetical protein AVEN_215378-1 [Araneus ventricosus]